MRRFLYIILLAIAVLAAPKSAYADIAAGTYDNVSWRITDNGELILGNGGTQTMTNRTQRQGSSYPWYSYRSNIKNVKFNGIVRANGSARSMFYDHSELISVDTTGFNTSMATDMRYMFEGCKKLKTIDVSNFDTSNVTDMRSMFNKCNSIESLDISSFDTQKVTSMALMFYDCTVLSDLDFSRWNTSAVTDMSNIFGYCRGMDTINLSSFDFHNVTDMSAMFAECRTLKHIVLPDTIDTSKVTNMSYLFNNCFEVTGLDVSNFNTSKVTNMRAMFVNLRSNEALDVSRFDTSKVTSMDGMFYGNYKLKHLDLSNFDTSRVTNFYYDWGSGGAGMFKNCYALESLDISAFNTKAATNMREFFTGCNNLKSVSLGRDFSFKGNNITDATKQALLPTPDNKAYTGKWTREDGAEGPFAPEALRDTYSTNAGKYAGVWVWEEKPNGTVIYRTPGSEFTGSMPNQTIFTSEDFELAENSFYRPGYVFSHWQVLTVNGINVSQEMTFTDTIPADTFEAGATVELQAVMVPRNSNLELEDGTFDFVLMAGERIDFKNIPGGAKYQIWEETPDGWILVNQINAAGEIIPTQTIESAFVNKYIPGTATIQLNAAKTIDGHAPDAGAFTFELLNENDTVIETAANNATGIVQFDALSFTAPGTYTYKIREVHGDDSGIQYDSHTEIITVEVADHDGMLVATSSLGTTVPTFVNRTKPGTLKISKSTDGKGTGDEEFTFEINLTNEYGQPLNSVSAFIETSQE